MFRLDPTVPRRRRDVPRAVLVALWPLFRYSRVRDAWILRLIGEKYGPVLRHIDGRGAALDTRPAARPALPRLAPRRTASHVRRGARDALAKAASARGALAMPEAARRAKAKAAPPRRPTTRAPRRGNRARAATAGRPVLIRRRSLMLALSSVLLAAALGFLLAPTNGGRPAPLALNQHASAGLLGVSFPTGWRRQTPTTTQQLRLTDELALAPASPDGERLIIGRTNTTDPTLLPQTLLATLPAAPTAQTVRLGRTTFYRYASLSPRGQNLSESIYAVPTTVGTVLGLCVARAPRSSFTSSCERIFGTLRVSSGTLALGLSPTYASGLNAAINQLNGVRSKAGLQLSHAGDARLQAAAATTLAAAHAAAASALLRLNAGAASTANTAAATALKMTSQAYAAFASAAAHGDASRYSTARASLTTATKALGSAFTQLGLLGYRIG